MKVVLRTYCLKQRHMHSSQKNPYINIELDQLRIDFAPTT